jgi:hypothetical protein
MCSHVLVTHPLSIAAAAAGCELRTAVRRLRLWVMAAAVHSAVSTYRRRVCFTQSATPSSSST